MHHYIFNDHVVCPNEFTVCGTFLIARAIWKRVTIIRTLFPISSSFVSFLCTELKNKHKMKNRNLVLGTFAFLGVVTVSAQDMNPNDVPSELRTAFDRAHPNAGDVEWERDGESYKVEFEIDRQDQEVWYAADGKAAKTEKEIGENDLPQAIRSAIAGKYADYKIDSIEMTEADGSATYEVELEKGWDDERQVVFDAEGKVLSEWND